MSIEEWKDVIKTIQGKRKPFSEDFLDRAEADFKLRLAKRFKACNDYMLSSAAPKLFVVSRVSPWIYPGVKSFQNGISSYEEKSFDGTLYIKYDELICIRKNMIEDVLAEYHKQKYCDIRLDGDDYVMITS